MNILLLSAPQGILDLFKEERVVYTTSEADSPFDLVWIFTNTSKEMETSLNKLSKRIVSNGMIWVSWYKKASKMPTELNEDMIRDTALALDLVDVKVASVNDHWSGLKLVIPVKNR